MSTSNETIFALSSGHGRAGVSVIRVSGPAARSVLDLMAAPCPPPRKAALRRIRHFKSCDILDEALVLYFPAPASETGEDIVEIQGHGGIAVVRAILDALAAMPGLRLAEPGEFARRAFENGKMDLTQVEGLADLIDAETEGQRRQALAQASGALEQLYEGWRAQALKSLALVEAAIDFSDEGDVSDKAVTHAEQVAEVLAASLRAHLDDGHRGEILRDGFKVVLAGPPNAGKSSLLNALARRDVAIVSQIPGTTRDVIDVRLDLSGLPVVISDTAGVRDTSDDVEREGIRRTLARARAADLVLWLDDGSNPGSNMPAEVGALAAPVVSVGTKSDLAEPLVALGGVSHSAEILVSAKTGAGLPELIERIRHEANRRVGTGIASALNPVITQVRHRVNVTGCHEALASFLCSGADGLELRAEWLRLAANALGRLTGRIDADQVLGEIFGRFCIGK
jgi:tRNA modification GTPase